MVSNRYKVSSECSGNVDGLERRPSVVYVIERTFVMVNVVYFGALRKIQY